MSYFQWIVPGVTNTFYVDQASGNREYDGSSPTFVSGKVGPTTYDELLRRLAPKGLLRVPAATTVRVRQVGDANDAFLDVALDVDAEGTFILEPNAMTEVFSGALSAATNWNTGGQIGNATAAWTVATHKNRLVYDVNQDAYAWIDEDLGGGVAQVSNWITLNLTTGTTATTKNASNGDTAKVYTQPTLGGLALLIRRGSFDPGNFTPARGRILINNLNLTGNAGRVEIASLFQNVAFQNCHFGAASVRLNGGTITLHNCQGIDSAAIFGAYAASRVVMVSGHLYGVSPYTIDNGSVLTLSENVLARGQIRVNLFNTVLSVVRACFYGVANPIVVLDGGLLRVSNALWGVGNTGVGVAFQQATRMNYVAGSTLSLTGSSDFTLGGNATAPAFDTASGLPTLPRTLSWANLAATVASGGFGGRLVDPITGCSLVTES